MRRVLITGATKGIGRSIAELLAEKGYHLYMVSRTLEDLETWSKQLQESYPDQDFCFSAADLSLRSDQQSVVQELKDQWGTLDILINNTGVFLGGPLMEEEDGQLEFQMNTNLYSAYHLTRGLFDLLSASDHAHIINMCSIASIMAYPGGGSYTITKFAMLGFNKVLRKELMNTSIKVTAILPGATWSNSWAGAEYPEDRLMQPEDVAQVVLTALELPPGATMEEVILRPQKGDL